ncbi:prolyl-tRNA synthetase associated domain-containing protein, partial [Candidatus Saccharibacteria bacterium]|jgi:Ala-tRNA(Pro) deacylase|nr:prolyl-tRNA synthetase associated domain-containing protein [Candidatus Saccharibacteria bacterium]
MHTHATVFTCDEANEYRQGIKGISSKNLLLQNKKKVFLVIIAAYKQIDLEVFAAEVNERKISFAASKALYDLLNLTRGSVSPFGLINDTTK